MALVSYESVGLLILMFDGGGKEGTGTYRLYGMRDVSSH